MILENGTWDFQTDIAGKSHYFKRLILFTRRYLMINLFIFSKNTCGITHRLDDYLRASTYGISGQRFGYL
jgi:hypothetical protein